MAVTESGFRTVLAVAVHTAAQGNRRVCVGCTVWLDQRDGSIGSPAQIQCIERVQLTQRPNTFAAAKAVKIPAAHVSHAADISHCPNIGMLFRANAIRLVERERAIGVGSNTLFLSLACVVGNSGLYSRSKLEQPEFACKPFHINGNRVGQAINTTVCGSDNTAAVTHTAQCQKCAG